VKNVQPYSWLYHECIPAVQKKGLALEVYTISTLAELSIKMYRWSKKQKILCFMLENAYPGPFQRGFVHLISPLWKI